VYLPKAKDREAMDAIAVLPPGSGYKNQTLVVLQTKFALEGTARHNLVTELIDSYNTSVEEMMQAGWAPGTNAAYMAVVMGAVHASEVARFHGACPHGRLLYGEGLAAAMGPTVYPYLQHWRTLEAETVAVKMRRRLRLGTAKAR
jgi:hypothetical protein